MYKESFILTVVCNSNTKNEKTTPKNSIKGFKRETT